MNPRAQAKHEARATLEAAKLRAERLNKLQSRTGQKIDDLLEAYRLQFQNGEHAELPTQYLRPRSQQIRLLRWSELNLYSEEFIELDKRRITLEVEAIKVEAATNTAHVRIISHLIARLIAWSRFHAENFSRLDAPSDPIPLEKRPTAAPNSPNTSN